MSIGRKISQFQRFREPDGHELHELFAKAMRGISAGGAYDVQHAVDGYPWQDLGESLVVDVGGGPGHVSMALAKKYSQLGFEVQDLTEVGTLRFKRSARLLNQVCRRSQSAQRAAQLSCETGSVLKATTSSSLNPTAI